MLSRLKTIIALMRNPRVSKLPKFLVVGAIFYLLMPVDIIPDVAPVIGWLDDIAFLLGAFALLFGAAPKTPDPAPRPGASSTGSAKGSAKDAIIDVTPEPPPAGQAR
ncbi:MAG: DUF1232 domain-containing protein [Vicinamibacteria bacterium]